MLAPGFTTTAKRVRSVAVLTLLLGIAPIAVVLVLAQFGLFNLPRASSDIGVFLGVLGGAIIFFEMALAPRKWLRGKRLGVARLWMRAHIWLGLLVLPVIVIHSGFAWGGPLSAVTMILFLLVVASGIYGLILQQWLPRKLYDEVPTETIASQIDAIEKPVEEARRIIIQVNAPVLNDFFARTLEPFLRIGRRSGSPLVSPTEASKLFNRLRGSLPAEKTPAIYKLEKVAELRRQWDRQARINWWLHSWLIIHLPLSVLMTGLMIIHAIFAMRW